MPVSINRDLTGAPQNTGALDIGAATSSAVSKTTPVDGDMLPISDSAASNVLKKLTWANVKATLKTYFDSLYATATQGGKADTALQPSNNLSDLASASTARTNLGVAASGAITSSGLTQATARLLGRTTAGTGAVEEIAVSGGTLSGGTLTITSGLPSGMAYTATITTAGQDIFDVAGTFNGAGQLLDGIVLNVTDTASAATSRLLDLRVDGVSRTSVNKTGAWSISGNVTVGQVQIQASGNVLINVPSGFLMFANGTSLREEAVNTFAQYNGTAAQESRIYGTFTNTSNYRRVAMGMSTAGVGFVRPEGAGTGASGNVLHISGLPTSNPGPGILWNDAGTVKVGT